MTAQKNSQTPLTDAQPTVKLYDSNGQQYESTLVYPDFARKLEQQNAALKAALEESEQVMDEAVDYFSSRNLGEPARLLFGKLVNRVCKARSALAQTT